MILTPLQIVAGIVISGLFGFALFKLLKKRASNKNSTTFPIGPGWLPSSLQANYSHNILPEPQTTELVIEPKEKSAREATR